jgi:hypothetical protein
MTTGFRFAGFASPSVFAAAKNESTAPFPLSPTVSPAMSFFANSAQAEITRGCGGKQYLTRSQYDVLKIQGRRLTFGSR